MGKDYRQLWAGVTNATGQAEAVRALAEIVIDKQGRAFTLNLERKEAKSCVEILDSVSRDLQPPISLPHTVSPGYLNEKPRTRREESFLRHAEETC